MFGIKGRDTFNKPHSDLSDIIKKAGEWWMKLFPYLLIVLFCLVVYVAVHMWYKYVRNKEVTQQQKQDYNIQQSNSIKFKKDKFEAIEQELNVRREMYDAPRQEYADIFYGKAEEESEEEYVDSIEKYEQTAEQEVVTAELFKPIESKEDSEE